ncbi:polyprenyl synthetase family protein [soil metagenome]
MPPTRAVPVPPSLLAVAEQVGRRLDAILSAEQARWRDLSADLDEPLSALRTLVMAGGKRLRPAFCHWGYVGAGGDPEAAELINAGAAFELLQAFALVHDDVMDGSATRRGTRTAHLHFADRHRSESWRGEARRFGEGVAILIGDVAHVYADLLVAGAPPAATEIWNELRIELNVGQYLDILGTARGDVDHDGARQIARYKSGKYTIERPLHLGAALAGRLDDLEKPLSAYGDPLGEAFQLRDDILGAFGDSDAIGKPVGDDLREGKPTPLLALAVAAADGPQARLLQGIGRPELDGDDIAGLQQVLTDTGARAGVEEAIETLTATATEAIATAPVTDEARAALVDLAHYVANRDA